MEREINVVTSEELCGSGPPGNEALEQFSLAARTSCGPALAH